jgi:hypothetical protein
VLQYRAGTRRRVVQEGIVYPARGVAMTFRCTKCLCLSRSIASFRDWRYPDKSIYGLCALCYKRCKRDAQERHDNDKKKAKPKAKKKATRRTR